MCLAFRFLVYLSMQSAGASAKSDLWPVVELLMNTDKISAPLEREESQIKDDSRPTVLWASFHTHQVSQLHHPDIENVVHAGFPDGFVGYGDCIERAKGRFSKLFPDLSFMQDKETKVLDLLESDDDAFDDLESELACLGLSGAP